MDEVHILAVFHPDVACNALLGFEGSDFGIQGFDFVLHLVVEGEDLVEVLEGLVVGVRHGDSSRGWIVRGASRSCQAIQSGDNGLGPGVGVVVGEYVLVGKFFLHAIDEGDGDGLGGVVFGGGRDKGEVKFVFDGEFGIGVVAVEVEFFEGLDGEVVDGGGGEEVFHGVSWLVVRLCRI